MKFHFFIDTADTQYIKNLWSTRLQSRVTDPANVIGITTNPSALHKIGCDSFDKIQLRVTELSNILHDIRGDDNGIVYVQVPSSQCTPEEAIKFYRFLTSLNVNISMKIPYRTDLLYALHAEGAGELNVTGIADSLNILKSFTFPNVSFASLIVGRMDEAQLNTEEHLQYLNSIYKNPGYRLSIPYQNVITGAMRTFTGLKTAIEYNTIPTIGSKLFDVLTDQELDQLKNIECISPTDYRNFCDQTPLLYDGSKQLSKQFFEQMDGYSEKLYAELKTK